MSTIVNSLLLLGILGFVAGAFLAFASKKFAVKEDSRTEIIRAVLPGIDCGSCGFPGCAGFAKAFVKGEIGKDGCVPGKNAGVPELLEKISKMSNDELNEIYEKSNADEKEIKDLLLAK
ncbi:RnfABCDGE type electron transport complex subunit B [Petrotoga sp. 9PWA.NaAc.5.4]|uniref:RnfABCDGE type electron transport complex subunit B n=1 Tax=Petrotoga sp. 9PWA.NaAc.5.4 TaxID=1434328 RepID=UPI000CAE8827|nr:RnfABCDGE type electron transport complex subunit B [Petrotoga sp. 9PWA.NaAc.5.4]PNR96667.1 Fe-S cluster domain-containing protein [Petrotoga sp. 9PWA.NaAc.5.4]